MKHALLQMKNENLELKVQIDKQKEQFSPEINLDTSITSDQIKPCAKVCIIIIFTVVVPHYLSFFFNRMTPFYSNAVKPFMLLLYVLAMMPQEQSQR